MSATIPGTARVAIPPTPSATAVASASQQTTRIAGKRVVIRTSAKGKVSVKDALPEEWELQASQIRALKAHPDYGKRFLTAGDQNASKRGAKAQVQAIAAGMEAGEADVRSTCRANA